MRIVVNHLTRMHGGHMCVAGTDIDTRESIRPVPAAGHMPFYLLARYGGPFDMARVIDLGAIRRQPDPPHVEDHVFVAAWAKVERVAGPDEFWALMAELSRGRLRDIFGGELGPVGPGHYGTAAGRGLVSLGCFRPQARPTLYVTNSRDGKPQVRMTLSDGEIRADASVTDLRLYGGDHHTPDAALVRAVTRRLARSEDVILSVGLTRRFQPTEQSEPVHYLQVNNVHFKEEPIWQLA